ncbi:hypothetical protein NMZ80_12540 [Clostridioides difficile]|nr:hypothetical protein [Clostridioides difficile]MDV9710598.1 hypothetical protein [Clostridioides difficile]UUC40693.1 hypothetical protein NMZ80_12540 [Clostridioides difficile]
MGKLELKVLELNEILVELNKINSEKITEYFEVLLSIYEKDE